jgi:hypothetical protein
MMESPDAPGDETDIEPAEGGTRSDHAGTAASESGAAPKAGQASVGARTTPSDDELPAGDATGASGGYGSGSARRSSGGTGDGEATTGDDPETEWLRDAPGGAG